MGESLMNVVRKALLHGMLKRLGLDADPSARRPQDQRIIPTASISDSVGIPKSVLI